MKNTAAIPRPNYAACRRRAYIRTHRSLFPNAARMEYYLECLLDTALAAATTVGIVVSILFVLTAF